MADTRQPNEVSGGTFGGPAFVGGTFHAPVTFSADGRPVPRHLRTPERWPVAEGTDFSGFTTVASWRGAFGPLAWRGLSPREAGTDRMSSATAIRVG